MRVERGDGGLTDGDAPPEADLVLAIARLRVAGRVSDAAADEALSAAAELLEQAVA